MLPARRVVKIIAKQQAKPVSAVDVARRFKNHPALAGYMLMDEPSTADFPALAKMAREVLALDAEKLVLVNLYPTYATKEQMGIKPYAEYSDYVYKFLSEVPVNLLSYDFYPIMRSELLPDWHQNLNVGYEAARNQEVPLGSGLRAPHGAYSRPDHREPPLAGLHQPGLRRHRH